MTSIFLYRALLVYFSVLAAVLKIMITSHPAKLRPFMQEMNVQLGFSSWEEMGNGRMCTGRGFLGEKLSGMVRICFAWQAVCRLSADGIQTLGEM